MTRLHNNPSLEITGIHEQFGELKDTVSFI